TDVREPAEGDMGSPGTADQTEHNIVTKSELPTKKPRDNDDLLNMLRGYLKGKVKDSDIEEMFPAPDEKARKSRLASDLGTQQDIERAKGIEQLKQAFQTIQQVGLKHFGKKLAKKGE